MLERPDSPKLVLLDLVLPDIEGIELCQQIRAAGSSRPYVYVILLTSKEARQNMLDAMEAGADDYLVKPFDELELKARLMGWQAHPRLAGRARTGPRGRHAATHDSLTELLNRGEILAMLQRELERARRERNPVSVILADIDYFKQVNDTLGHLFGDHALQEIARRLRSGLRVYDGIGRFGGEEFLLSRYDSKGLAVVADFLQSKFTSKMKKRRAKNVADCGTNAQTLPGSRLL